MNRIRVLIADDHRLVAAGIRAALSCAGGDIEVVGIADSGSQVLPLVRRLSPDLVLLDVQMPRMDGIACLDALRAKHPEVKCIVLSGHGDSDLIARALRHGASAYVLKSIAPDDLAPVIRQVARGTVFGSLAPATEPPQSLPADLTKREAAILEAVARGLSNDAIAKELWVTPQTVKFHLRNVYRKLGVTNRTEAARFAYQHDLAPSPALAGIA